MIQKEIQSRRAFLKFLGYGGIALSNSAFLSGITSCTFEKDNLGISPSLEDQLLLSKGLKYSIIASWGDKINDTESFGFNNDYINILPLSDDDLIMWVNHEYFHPLFVSGLERTKENVDKELKLVGGTLMRVRKEAGQWKMVPGDKYNRGIRGDTPIPFAQEQSILGSKVAMGTIGNCAGGKTPWNTFLTCEENYHLFYGERLENGGVSTSWFEWQKFYQNPPEHYGWVVEVEPKTGKSKKHINLGRFAHESATCALSKSAKGSKVVVYSGDDKNDEHLYKFVSETADSFDRGILYAADINSGKWLPLDLELSPVLKTKFKNHQEVMINARTAAKMLGATPLARPEDIEVNPITGDVFVALTNNKPKQNYHGQILKIQESGGDYVSTTFNSEVFYTGGQKGGLSCPDNLAFDRNGNLWVCTDISGSSIDKKAYKGFGNNGLFVIPAKGSRAGEAIQIASAPRDAEFTGLCFSPDQKTLFLSVQHPGEQSKELSNPTSRWPDGGTPKPSVVAIEGAPLEKLTT